MKLFPLVTSCAIAAAAGGGSLRAQSLFQAPPPQSNPAPDAHAAAAAQAEPLYAMSLYALHPVEPRQYKANDLVTILVNETSQMTHDQTLDTKKNYTFDAPRIDLPTLFTFFALNGSEINPLDTLKLGYHNETKSDGEFERKDRIDARITARVLEVKPNGTLLLEARSSTQTDKEKQTMLLSGICRSEDITDRNTVLSSQIFDLKLQTTHEGDVKEATKKGLFPILLETLFNF